MPLQIGQTLLNKYHIERLIGEGGFGYVYEATDLLLQRRVAIKELKAEVSRDSEAFQRFIREAQAAGAINHPNIVTTHSLEVSNGDYFIVMELMDGGSLADKLRQRRALIPGEALNIALALLDALAGVHARGIVHRDIKPSNILFSTDGRIRLGDFGIAHIPAQGEQSLTASGLALGTVYYMSPEQARGERVDARSDLYALGAVLYEMLTGRPYLNFGDNFFNNLELIKTRAPSPLPSPPVPQGLSNVVVRALRKQRDARFQNASEMSNALRSLHEPRTELKQPSPPTEPPAVHRPVRVSRLLPIAGAAILGILLLIIAAFLNQSLVNQVALSQQTKVPATQSIPIAVPPTVVVATLTSAPSVAPVVVPTTPTQARAATPTDAGTLTPIPSWVSTTTPMTATAGASPTPPSSSPPQGEIWYPIPMGSTVTSLIRFFFLKDPPDPAQVQDLYDRHPEIWCSPAGGNPVCLRSTTIRIKWSELTIGGLVEALQNPSKLSWLQVYLDDGTLGIRGLDVLKSYKGHWVLVRGEWQQETTSFRREPPNLVFVWNGQVYETVVFR